MDEVLFHALGVAVTPWKLVGYAGVVLFAGRWFVQVLYSRWHGRPVLPTAFWVMSISGSALLLAYFTFGKNDSVGILSNLFPASVSCYNLFLDLRHKRRRAELAGAGGAPGGGGPG